MDTLVVRSNAVMLDGGGRIALRSGPSAARDTFRVSGRAGDLTPLALLAGADSVVMDSTLLDLTVSRGLRSAEGSKATPTPSGCSMPAPWPSDSPPRVRDDGQRRQGRVRRAAAGHRRRLGKLSVHDINLTARYDSVVALQGTIDVNDDIGLALDLAGRAGGDSTVATLRRLDLREGRRKWGLARPAGIALRPDVVEVRGFTLRAGDRSIALDGIFARRDSSDMTMRITGFDLDALEEARLVPIAGRLDGTLKLLGARGGAFAGGQGRPRRA